MTAMQMVNGSEAIELRIANALVAQRNGMIAHKPRGRDKEKDLTIFLPSTLEIKHDVMSEETGNAFLETYNSRLRESSGLTATKADLWVHYLPSHHALAVFRPKKMLGFLKTSHYRFVELVGDDNSDGYLVPTRELLAFDFVSEYEFYE